MPLPNVSAQAPQTIVVANGAQFMPLVKKVRQKLVLQGGVPGDQAVVSFQCPRAGLGIGMKVIITGSLTIAGTSGGTFSRTAPYSIIRQINFGNSSANVMRKLSGYSQYLWQRARLLNDVLTKGATNLYSAGNQQFFNQSGAHVIRPGAAITNNTYTFCLAFDIPLAYNLAGDLCLLPLQNTSNFILELDFGSIVSGVQGGGSNDLFTGVVGGTVTLGAINISTVIETCTYPDPRSVNAAKLTSQYMRVIDGQWNNFANGQTYNLLPNCDLMSWFHAECLNNGVVSNINNGDIANVQLLYGGSQYLVQEDFQQNVFRDYLLNDGTWPTDGSIHFDLRRRLGTPDRADTSDTINCRQITDLALQVTSGGSSITNGQINYIHEAIMGTQAA